LSADDLAGYHELLSQNALKLNDLWDQFPINFQVIARSLDFAGSSASMGVARDLICVDCDQLDAILLCSIHSVHGNSCGVVPSYTSGLKLAEAFFRSVGDEVRVSACEDENRFMLGKSKGLIPSGRFPGLALSVFSQNGGIPTLLRAAAVYVLVHESAHILLARGDKALGNLLSEIRKNVDIPEFAFDDREKIYEAIVSGGTSRFTSGIVAEEVLCDYVASLVVIRFLFRRFSNVLAALGFVRTLLNVTVMIARMKSELVRLNDVQTRYRISERLTPSGQRFVTLAEILYNRRLEVFESIGQAGKSVSPVDRDYLLEEDWKNDFLDDAAFGLAMNSVAPAEKEDRYTYLSKHDGLSGSLTGLKFARDFVVSLYA